MNNDKSKEVHLIDYGLAEEYMDEFGDHLPQEVTRSFSGSIIFASKYGVIGKTQSR